MTRPLCQTTVILLFLFGLISTSYSLPPFDEVMEELSSFRSAAGDVVGEGVITFRQWDVEQAELRRYWNDRVEIEIDGEILVATWSDTEADFVLRLVAAAIAADDLSEAVQSLGRSVEPSVETLAFISDEIVYVIGGALDAPTAHLYIERDTFRLRRVEIPMPDGQYRIELAGYELAEGWFPRSILVYCDTEKLFQLDLETLEELE